MLVSGEGSNLQALLDAGLPVVAVASSRPGVPALGRAREAGVETGVFAIADARSGSRTYSVVAFPARAVSKLRVVPQLPAPTTVTRSAA